MTKSESKLRSQRLRLLRKVKTELRADECEFTIDRAFDEYEDLREVLSWPKEISFQS